MGIFLAVLGAALLLAGRWGIPFGRLPGDITYQKKNITVFIPLGSMLLISLVISVILNIFSRWER